MKDLVRQVFTNEKKLLGEAMSVKNISKNYKLSFRQVSNAQINAC